MTPADEANAGGNSNPLVLFAANGAFSDDMLIPDIWEKFHAHRVNEPVQSHVSEQEDQWSVDKK